MKARVVELLTSIFGVALMVAVLTGGLVAVIYLIGFIVGGTAGEQLAILGAQIMKYCITLAAIGSVIGMFAFYIEGTHELVMDNKKDANSQETAASH